MGSLSAALSAPPALTWGEYEPFALLGPPAYPPAKGPSPELKSSFGSLSLGRDPDDWPGSCRDGRTGAGAVPGGESSEDADEELFCELADEAWSLRLILDDLRTLRGATSPRL